MFELTQQLLILIALLILVQFVLILFALNDLRKQEFENKLIWFVIILIGTTFGPIIYFLVAPREATGLNFDNE